MALYGIVAFTLLILFEYIALELGYGKEYLFTYTFQEFLFLGTVLYLNIKTPLFRKIVIALAIAFVVFDVLFYLYGNVKRLDSIPVGVETIILFIVIFLFLFEHFKASKASYIYNHNGFWISVGILVYLGGSFFFNILVNIMPEAEADKYETYTHVADILKNFLFVVAIWIFSKQQDQNTIRQEKTTVPFLDMI